MPESQSSNKYKLNQLSDLSGQTDSHLDASNSLNSSDQEVLIQVSHHKTRCFRPEKLNAPRDFVIPKFIDPYKSVDTTIVNNRLMDNNRLIVSDGSIDTSNFRKSRPLIVEIGAGKGTHACLYAKQHPQHDLIAIERTQNKFMAFKKLMESVSHEVVELDNLLAIHADAIPYCVYALPPASVDMIYVLYPNPEPKNPNQQWLNMPFFEFLLSRLKSEGKVILASNIAGYIDNAYEQSVNTWKLPTNKSQVAKDSRRTHFEIKYLARGETCWELEMSKPAGYNTRFDEWVSSALQQHFAKKKDHKG